MVTTKTNKNIITDLLSRMSPTLEKMVQRIKLDYEKNNDRPFTAYSAKLTRLMLEKDIVKSFSTYTQPTDILISFKINGSKSGQLVIDAIISRDTINYQHITNVVYAGGYNIQRLHYRYLTKTDLPKTGDKTILQKFTDAIKSLNKIEALSNEISSIKRNIEFRSKEIDIRQKLSDQDILNDSESYQKYAKLTWGDMIERDCTKNFDNDENNFIKSQTENHNRTILFYKNITSSKINSLELTQKNVFKLEEKLAKLLAIQS